MNDLISRQSVIDYFEKAFDEGWTVQDTLDGLKDIPSIQPERKKGEWIDAKWKHVKSGEIRESAKLLHLRCWIFPL